LPGGNSSRRPGCNNLSLGSSATSRGKAVPIFQRRMLNLPARRRAAKILRSKKRARSHRTYDLKKSAFLRMNPSHLAGTSGSKKIAETGQTGSHAPQSVQIAGSIYICCWAGPPCMQSTGQTSTQASSLVPIHGSQITKAKKTRPPHSHSQALTRSLAI
jgi:hypothetical protein